MASMLERWRALCAKLDARIDEVHEEALHAYHDIAATAPLDIAPLAALDSAVTARFVALQRKLDGAHEKVSVALAGGDVDADHHRLSRRLDQAPHRCLSEGRGRVATAIESALAAEDPTQHCPQCGGPVDPGHLPRTVTQPCPSCGAQASLSPRPAAAAWFRWGLQARAEALALGAWGEAERAEARYREQGDRSSLEALVAARRDYRLAYSQHLVDHHPEWNRERADRWVEASEGQLRAAHRRWSRAG